MNADGSGTIDLTYGMPEDAVRQLQSFASEGSTNESVASNPLSFTDEDIRRDFKEFEPEGVVLKSVSTETREGWEFRHLLVAFRDLQGLAKTGFISDRGLSIRREDGRYVFEQSSGATSAPPEMPEGEADAMRGMMKGFRAQLTVKTPGKILESNAPERTDDSATWTFDLEKDPQALEKIQQTTLRIVFDGQGVSMPEFRSARP